MRRGLSKGIRLSGLLTEGLQPLRSVDTNAALPPTATAADKPVLTRCSPD
jgi:hypothetical protein